MNERRKAQLIDECLDAVIEGMYSESDCFMRYPEIQQELLDAFYSFRQFHSAETPQLSTEKMRRIKKNILFNLPDRDMVVTKPSGLRYRWQNTKRRFAMTWVIIVTTILSLLSGAGAVYASNDALPGEFLYPVKTWVEDVQLVLSPDDVDVELSGIFASRRIEELLALIEEGDLEDLDELVDGYHNRTELMTQLIAQIKARNPEEAIRLRLDLETKLQEHALIIETLIDDEPAEDELPLQDRLRVMLQTNMQTRLRINEEEVEVPEESDELNVDDSAEVESSEEEAGGDQEKNQYQNQNQNKVVYSSDEYLENGSLFFQFKFADSLEDDVYGEVDGTLYDCSVDGSMVTCGLTGSAGKGILRLYNLRTHELLYSYDYDHDYEYLWGGTKEGGNENQERGETDHGDRDQEGGMDGKDK